MLESVYERALVHELLAKDLRVATQVGIPVRYKNQELDLGFRMDILVEDAIIIEVKSIEAIMMYTKNNCLLTLNLQTKS